MVIHELFKQFGDIVNSAHNPSYSIYIVYSGYIVRILILNTVRVSSSKGQHESK